MNTILQLRENRAKKWDAAKAFLDVKRGTDGLLSAEDAQAYEKMEAEVVALGKEVERLERQAALDAELGQLPRPFRPESVFLGGGTPTELAEHDLARLLDLLHRRVDLSAVEEWSCESNPGTLTAGKARLLKEAGVNRMSLGVQSFDAGALAFLGRIHTAREAEASYALLRQTGFTNINLDLIYGIPGSPTTVLERDLARLLDLAPEHAACYALIFEDGTPLAGLRARGLVREVDDDTELEQYRLVCSTLGAGGYLHYELSNFARPGRDCRHNRLYWNGGEYLGVGPAAHSHWRGERSGNVRDLSAYLQQLAGGASPRAFRETLPPAAKARETLVMALRQTDGIRRADFQTITGFEVAGLCGDTLQTLAGDGLLELTPERIRLTEAGLFISDSIFAELI